MKEQFEILLPLVLAGEASTEQEKAFFELLEKDQALEAEYRQALNIWLSASATSFDADEALAKMNFEQPKVIPIASAKKKRYMPAVAASVIALVGLFSIYMWKSGIIGSSSPEMVLVATTDNIKEVQLPDGSVVWLNRHSQIQYPKDFAGDERRVKLEGEAYFDVARNEEKPFITEMNGSETKVLGTEFNLNEQGKDIELTVTEGKVSFGAINDKKPLIVNAGFAATLNKDYWGGDAYKMDINTMAWKTHKMIFEKASAEYVVHVLSIAYGKKYSLGTKLPEDVQFTGTFINKSQTEAQSILSQSLGIVFTESPNGVIVEYNP